MGQADELPFCLDAIETTEKKSSKASHVLDLAKDGFDGFFSFRVRLPALLGSQEPFHPFFHGELLRDSATRRERQTKDLWPILSATRPPLRVPSAPPIKKAKTSLPALMGSPFRIAI